MTSLVIVAFLVLLLPPLIFALRIAFVLFLIRRCRKRSLAAIAIIMALGYGAEAGFLHWLRTPQAPSLSEEQAVRILRSRPEFMSQGYAPSFRSIEGPHGSVTQCFGGASRL